MHRTRRGFGYAAIRDLRLSADHLHGEIGPKAGDTGHRSEASARWFAKSQVAQGRRP